MHLEIPREPEQPSTAPASILEKGFTEIPAAQVASASLNFQEQRKIGPGVGLSICWMFSLIAAN